MPQAPQTLLQKLVAAHTVGGRVKASVTLKTTGRKPKGFEGGHALPSAAVKVPKEHPLTQGAFGALAFRQAIDVENAPAARISFNGVRPKGVGVTDLALYAATLLPPTPEGTNGWGVEVDGSVIIKFSIEERMRLCALLSEMPQVACAIMPPDDVVIRTIGATDKQIAQYRLLQTDKAAVFAEKFMVDTPTLAPHATWTTELTNGAAVLSNLDDITAVHEKAMLPKAGTPMKNIPIDYVYIGPFDETEADALEAAVNVFKGRKVASGVQCFITPENAVLKALAEQKGWDKTFIHSGCIWNPSPAEFAAELKDASEKTNKRTAQTLALIGTKIYSQRTHFMSAQMAATAAICGRIADVRDFI